MNILKRTLLFSFIAFFCLTANAQKVTKQNLSAVFSTKYTKDFVWDVQRSPADPVMGKVWTLSGLKGALDFSGAAIDWGNGRYVMLVLEADKGSGINSLINDIELNAIRQNVMLNLYESNGTFVKTVSKWGHIKGMGDAGFLYEVEGKYGTFFSNTSLTTSSIVKYRVVWIKASKLSQFNIVKAKETVTDNNITVVNTPVNVPVFSNKYTKENVWDTQRSPAYPTAGQDWSLTGLNMPLTAKGTPIDWGNGRYLMFSLENDNSNSDKSLIDDIRNGVKQNLALNLYESNGKLVQVVSTWGYVIGISEQGFMYEVEGRFGTYFSNTSLTAANTVKYKPSLAKVTKVSELSKAKIMANASTNNITWKPEITTGYYTLMARCSNKYLDVLDASDKDGAVIQQWDLNGNQAQHWKIEPVLNLPGHYTLTARRSGKLLDVEGGSAQSGARIQQWTANGTASQQWKIEPVAGAPGFFILTAKCSGKVLDVLDASSLSGAKIQQWHLNGNQAQHWKLTPTK